MDFTIRAKIHTSMIPPATLTFQKCGNFTTRAKIHPKTLSEASPTFRRHGNLTWCIFQPIGWLNFPPKRVQSRDSELTLCSDFLTCCRLGNWTALSSKIHRQVYRGFPQNSTRWVPNSPCT